MSYAPVACAFLLIGFIGGCTLSTHINDGIANRATGACTAGIKTACEYLDQKYASMKAIRP